MAPSHLILHSLLTLARFLLLLLRLDPFLLNDLLLLPHLNICFWELHIAHACGHQNDSAPAECSPFSVPSGRQSLHSQKFSEPNCKLLFNHVVTVTERPDPMSWSLFVSLDLSWVPYLFIYPLIIHTEGA